MFDEDSVDFQISDNASFAKYGKQFQEGIFQGMLYDRIWAAQMVEVMNPSFFDVRYLEFLCEQYFQYYMKYKCFPSLGLLVPMIKEELNTGSDIILQDQIIDYLHRIKTNPHTSDLQYIKDKSLDFCKRQAFRDALEQAVDLIQTDKFESVVGLMKEAVAVGMPSSVGHDFFEDLEARFVESNRQVCPTGISRLDEEDILRGGLGRGEIGVITANTGVGKCTVGGTYVKVSYTEVIIDGKPHKPWDKIPTKQGEIYARDAEEKDVMLKIEFAERKETLQIQDLFKQLGYDYDDPQEVKNEWPIEILSFDGYYPIEGYRTVEEQETIKITTECGKVLEGALDHIVLTHETGWTKLKDLELGQQLVSHDHSPVVSEIEYTGDVKKLYDFQVATSHSFMTNGILSHNSHFLVQMGANAMRVGKNVVHYTFELSETAVGLRYDSNLCDIPSNEVPNHKEEVLKRYEDSELGRLIIKEYPTGSASVVTIRNHIEKLMMKGFVPSLIVVDYADVMRSTRQFDSLRHELKLVYEELRNLSMEMNVPVWTASQANRDSANSDIVGLENMSEAYGKAMVADVVLSISRKAMEKDQGTGRMFIAKNRAGRDGVLFPIQIDTAMSKIDIVSKQALSLNEAVQQDNNAMKDLLKEKWNQVRSL